MDDDKILIGKQAGEIFRLGEENTALKDWIKKALEHINERPCTCSYDDCRYCLDAEDLLETAPKEQKK